MTSFTSSPLFGIALSLVTYMIACFFYDKKRISILNPLLTAVLMCMMLLLVFRVPIENYQVGGNVILVFLGPATACLAVAMYDRLPLLRKFAIPILCGTAVGAAVAMGSVFVLCRLFGLDPAMTASLLPKSVTTPFAIAVSESLGGDPSISVAAVVFTGIFGSTVAPLLLKIFRVRDSIAAGIGIGVASHASGTARALEIGETEGAASGAAIGLTGIFTVLFSMFFL